LTTTPVEKSIDFPKSHWESLIALPRGAKRLLAILADSALCILTVWLAICFRFESWVSLVGYQWLAVIISVCLAIPLLSAFGFYHTVIRYVGRQTITAALRAIAVYTIIYSAIFTAWGLTGVPRSIGILQPLLLLIGLAMLRIGASQLLGEQPTSNNTQDLLPSVLIYGAGNSGQQLAASLRAKGESRVVGFLDDNKNLQNASISGIPVFPPSALTDLTTKHQIKDVLLAMPSLSRTRRNEIIKLLAAARVAVRTLPSLSDLASGKSSDNSLRELDIEDLLGRDPVKPIPELLTKNITGKVVLVTGAGGSIGSELCRQIIKLAPSSLILVDASEFALYTIQEELLEISESELLLVPVLANVQQADQIARIIHRKQPHTIYHAAAYKHVPLVESNPLAGLRNNILGTLHVAQAALDAGVQDMVLISTDKAVRPTNIMGASKRIAEMVLQSLAAANQKAGNPTRFCMVRFGNVLASSGSVIPKFRDQISKGGPVTVTHPDVTRYFMTIPEAAQLVIQAAAMRIADPASAQVFLLDMGQSVKIMDLAKTLIQLSGLSVRDQQNPDGDIEITTTGLRPGEKLYEELLIAGLPEPTQHPKIMRSSDCHPTWTQLEELFHLLTDDADSPNLAEQLQVMFSALNVGYVPAIG
jgi:FlaA1/EpsC-like NDP-sugar epimerase